METYTSGHDASICAIKCMDWLVKMMICWWNTGNKLISIFDVYPSYIAPNPTNLEPPDSSFQRASFWFLTHFQHFSNKNVVISKKYFSMVKIILQYMKSEGKWHGELFVDTPGLSKLVFRRVVHEIFTSVWKKSKQIFIFALKHTPNASIFTIFCM